jgi:hypothetical protein
VLDFDPATANETARAVLARLAGTTAAVTTPARGVHFWFTLPAGVVVGNGRGILPAGLDVRAHAGYVLIPPAEVTYHDKAAKRKGLPDGHRGCYELVRAGPVAPIPAGLLAGILQDKPRKAGNGNCEAHIPGLAAFTPERHSPPMNDAQVLAVACRLPSGDKFRRLWGGDTSGYTSTSEAVKALVNGLTFVTQDVDQVARLFERSRLRELYERWPRLAQHEILESLATHTSFYRGKPRENTHARR